MAQGAAYRPKLGALNGREVREADDAQRLQRAVFVAAAVLILECVLIPFTSPRFAVREIVLRGDPHVTGLVVKQVALLPKGANFFRAPVNRLAKAVRAVPAVQQARVNRSVPNRIVVTVERREAVAVMRQADEARLVDSDGVVFSVPDEWGWGLPELMGAKLTKDSIGTAEGKAEVATLLGVLRTLGPDPRLRVARLGLTRDGVIEAALESGARVRFGDGEQLDVKIKLLLAALDQLGADRVEYMDLSNPRAAYWRERTSRS
jgi:cell division protein FtsQ